MTRQWELTPEAFDALLRWLDSDREKAGKKYEEIRRDLIRKFVCRGCAEAEDSTDETINRVAQKLPEIVDTYVGPREPYFYRVAHYVYLEYIKRLKGVVLPPQPDPPDEAVFDCLDKCLDKLSKDDRELILMYYSQDGQAKIDLRRQLAERLGIEPNALRIRLHRLRRELRECIENCLRQAGFA